MTSPPDPPGNALLFRLPCKERRRLHPFLRPVDLRPGSRLDGGARSLGGIWFPASGFLSVLLRDGRGAETEVAMVGREGAADVQGLEAPPGRVRWRLMAQQRGAAQVVASWQLPAAIEVAPALSDVLRIASGALFAQVAGTVHAAARGRVVERLARWLLMAHDRVEGDALHLTHDRTAIMLGVRRAGVSEALHRLEGDRLVRAHRGRVRILDRAGLIAATNGLYTPGEPCAPAPPARAAGPEPEDASWALLPER